jgi:hypothetical protein
VQSAKWPRTVEDSCAIFAADIAELKSFIAISVASSGCARRNMTALTMALSQRFISLGFFRTLARPECGNI